MSGFKQCTYCGRVGVRGFTSPGGGTGISGLLCTASRSCRRRRQGQDGFLVKRIAKRGR